MHCTTDIKVRMYVAAYQREIELLDNKSQTVCESWKGAVEVKVADPAVVE